VRLGPDFGGRTVQGDGLDLDALREAGVETADGFVACTSGDNRNLTASQFARDVFHVPRIVSRVSDPLRGEIYKELGVPTVSPTVLGADLIHDALLGKVSTVDCD
jgi:trk system potassium uptake protein TrkA